MHTPNVLLGPRDCLDQADAVHNYRAQAEIDAVIGENRSPTWEDFDRLPYINMMIKESHRWRPVSPLGVSHAVAEGKASFHKGTR